VSGIAALFARGGVPADAGLLGRLVAAQRFRGPDGQGSWLRGSVGLGHTQHKTTLEAEREVSPASLEDRLFITADARIDARDELCARLRDCGRDLPLDLPDPELVLHAYDAWGEGCLRHLLGDFSFALWDAPRRRLLCAVDALGARAFYYADHGGSFVGSNTLACVRLHDGVRDELDERAVGDFILLGGYEDRGITIYADIKRIPPGHCLIVDDDGARLTRYFDWPEPVDARAPSPDDCLEQFRALLAGAVRDRLRTPKLAVLMSGGVDSSLVALTAKRQLDRQFATPELRAYCTVYDHLIPDDERRHARLVADSLSIPIDFQAMDDGALFDWVGRLSPAEPLADVVIGPFLDQLARLASRASVVLTGYDGDTLLMAAVRLHWKERLAGGELSALVRELVWYVTTQRALPPIGVRTAIAGRQRAVTPRRRPSWLREELWQRAGLERRWSAADLPAAPARSREPSVRAFAGRAWGPLFDGHDPGYLGRPIDFRHPLLDLRLIRFAMALPAIPWCANKHLLRRCLDDLPAAIRRRPKTPLARDPVAQLIQRRGIDAVRVPRSADRLAPLVDLRAAREALGRASDPIDDPWIPLRALALGTWLEQRDAGEATASHARPAC
jgi:asparagine synthase (glutamine-hydrolysing)